MSDLPAAPSQSPPRLYYLDTLRVIAILFVFLFHAVHPYDEGNWHVKNIETSLTLSVILLILGMFGMQFFFMIAGSGGWFALRRRTAKQYVIERTRRLFVPFVVFTVISFFICQYYEWTNRTYRGLIDVTFPQYLQATREWHLAFGISPVWLSLGGHLWFLGFLYAFAMLSLPLFMWFKGPGGARFVDWLARICNARGGLLIFLLALIPLRYLLQPVRPQEHDWSDFVYQGTFYLIGFLLFARESILKAVRRDGWLLGGIGLAAILVLLVLFVLGYDVSGWYEAYGQGVYYLVTGLVTVVGLAWSLALLFLGMRYMDKDKAWVRYANELALPFFIVHQPVILFIAGFVVKWDIGIPIKLLVTVVTSFFICWGLVELIIKRVGFLRFLFGMTSPAKPARPETLAAAG